MTPKNESARRPGRAPSPTFDADGTLAPDVGAVKPQPEDRTLGRGDEAQPSREGGAEWPGDDAPPIPLDDLAVPRWPDDALPPIVGDFVAAVAASVQVPRDLAGMVALGLMSACWAGKVRAWPCGDYRESLCIYAVAAADVGERKSANGTLP